MIERIYMTNEADISEALQAKHQEMLLNKKIIDIDKSIESLLIFFNNFFDNLALDIDNKMCIINYGTNTKDDEMSNKIIDSFFKMFQDELEKCLGDNINEIKDKISTIDETEYNKELSEMAILVTNHMSDYYLNNINLLVDEIASTKDVNKKNRISEYLINNLYRKVMDTLKDQLMYSIRVIDNNYEENNNIIQSISEKTLKQV